MAKSKTISVRMGRNAVMWAIILFLLSLFFLLLLIDPVSAQVAKLFDVTKEEVNEFAKTGFIGSLGVGAVIVGLIIAANIVWLGVPIAVIGIVLVGIAAWNIWNDYLSNDMVTPHKPE